MAFGGGTFISRNKKLPGAYINFISKAAASTTLSDRGYIAMAFELDWGKDNEIFTVTAEDFAKNSLSLFGYAYDDPKLKGLRDVFDNATTLYAYKLNSGAVKASNAFATAKCGGVRGNDIKIVIQKNVDDATKFDVATFLDTRKVDSQTVATASELVANDYVTFKDAELTVTASTALSGGTNGDTVTTADHQSFLNKAESYAFNIIAVVSTDSAVNRLYANYAKRMRNEHGLKFQAVVYNCDFDDESVINVKNPTTDGSNEASLVYWVAGLQAGTAINASAMNTRYTTGEFTFKVDYTQTELEETIDNGEFVLMREGDDIVVLKDINSLVSVTAEKGNDFKNNQVIRIIDAIATSVATIFKNQYLGRIPNDQDGRVSLWSDIVQLFNSLVTIRAIEPYDAQTIVVKQGDNKGQVLVDCAITPIVAMEQLYMTTVVE